MTGTSPVPRGISAAVPAVATHAVETFREVCWPLGEGIREFQGGLGREPSVAFWSFPPWEESEFSSLLSS